MKRFRMMILAAASLFLAVGAAQASVDAFTSGNLNMRVGPGTGHARIVTIPADAGVTIYGCSGNWCDVGWAGYRGWVSARYLDTVRHARRYHAPRRYQLYIAGPVIRFHFGNAWGPHYHRRHYHPRPIYRPRPHFHHHWHHRHFQYR